MRVPLYTLLSFIFFTGLIHAQPEWEKVAVEGITAINTGDGDKLVEIGHTEYKKKFKESMLRLFKSFPEKNAIDLFQKYYGLDDFKSVEALNLDHFVRLTNIGNYKNNRPEMKEIIKTMNFTALSSVKKEDIYLVTVEVRFFAKGEERTSHMVLYSKQENGVWKYYGDPQTLK